MKALFAIALVALVVSTAPCAVTETESWEGTYTVLGMFGSGSPPIIAEALPNDPPGPVDGLQTLKLTDNSESGTPQVYAAWVRGLSDGDTVRVSIWRFDMSPGASPSCRLWGHWNDDPADVESYAGSAGGNSDYGPGTGWDEVTWTWTVEDGHTGLVIEIRTYSNSGDTVWVDMMTVTASDGAEILTPFIWSPVENRSWAGVKGLYR